MYDHSTGRRLIQCSRITSIVQKTYFTRARRLQRGHTLEEQFEFIRNTACRARNNCKRMRPASAKEPCVAQNWFDHLIPRKINSISVFLDAVDVKAKVSFGSKADFRPHARHFSFGLHNGQPMHAINAREVPISDILSVPNGTHADRLVRRVSSPNKLEARIPPN
jgi:hypothetical protein